MRTLIVLLCVVQGIAQNAVKDGGFESPFRSMSDSDGWHSCSPGETPDFFDDSAGVLFSRYRGGTTSRSGRGHAGLFVYRSAAKKNGEIREFLCGPLVRPLKRDSFYRVQVYVKPDDENNVLCDGFAIHFSEENVARKNTAEMLELKTHVVAPPRKVIPASGWTLISSDYKARGFERFVVIGNLKSDGVTTVVPSVVSPSAKRKKWRLRPGEQVAYYYVDELVITGNDSLNRAAGRAAEEKLQRQVAEARAKDSIRNLKDSVDTVKATALPVPPEQKEVVLDSSLVTTGMAITLPMIQFEHDRSDFTRGATGQLMKLLEFMLSRPGMEVEIRGYTDNAGSERYNQQLSLARANAVAKFLQLYGIPKQRVRTEGLGSRHPVASNDTGEGRAANRRIEIYILHE